MLGTTGGGPAESRGRLTLRGGLCGVGQGMVPSYGDRDMVPLSESRA